MDQDRGKLRASVILVMNLVASNVMNISGAVA
jgi:hypothetical protein